MRYKPPIHEKDLVQYVISFLTGLVIGIGVAIYPNDYLEEKTMLTIFVLVGLGFTAVWLIAVWESKAYKASLDKLD